MNHFMPRATRFPFVGLLLFVTFTSLEGCESSEQSKSAVDMSAQPIESAGNQESPKPAPTPDVAVNQPKGTSATAAAVDEKSAKPPSPQQAPKQAESSKPGEVKVPTTPVIDKKPQQPAAQLPKQEAPVPVASTRQEAEAVLAKVGGKVVYDVKLPEKPATLVRCQNRRVTDAVMGNLKFFPEVTQIEIIYPCEITDAALAHVAALANLRYINLEGTQITDAGLGHLKGLKAIERLRLINTRIGNAGLEHVKEMTKLTQLYLAFTEVGDEGLAHLEGLTSLRLLEVDDTKVTQHGIDRLKKALPKCKVQWNPNVGAPATGVATRDSSGDPPAEAASNASRDWPAWRGANRDARSAEIGLLQEWPADGPPLLWTATGIGTGYSTAAISDGQIFVTGRVTGAKSGTFLFCLDLDGKKLWERLIADDKFPAFSMPTVDGDLVYALAHEGELICAKTSNGEIVWRKNFVKDFKGDYMGRGAGGGYAESVLIDGDKLICTPGAKDAMVVALNKKTGELLWKAAYPADVGKQGHDLAGMSSPVISNACGIRHYVQLAGRGLIGIAADSGKTLWTYNGIANSFANIPTPIVAGDYVLGSSVLAADPTAGTALVKLTPADGGIKPEVVYRLDYRTAANHHGGMVLVGDYVYMGHGHNKGFPLCFEFKTGKVAWRPGRGPGIGSASVLYADGRLYFRYEDGTVALIDASPKAFKLISKFKTPPDTDTEWAHPVVSNGRLYLRGQNRLLCYDIEGHAEEPAKPSSDDQAQSRKPDGPSPIDAKVAEPHRADAPRQTDAKASTPKIWTIEEAKAQMVKGKALLYYEDKNPKKRVIGVRLDRKINTDEDMAALTAFPALSRLDVVFPNNITDEGFVHIAGLTELREIDLEGTNISDAGLVHFKGFNKLEQLRLISTNITSAGLAHLTELPSLRRLYLSFTNVGDDGFEHLKKIKNLRILELDDTNVTEQAVNEMRAARPECNVLFDPNHLDKPAAARAVLKKNGEAATNSTTNASAADGDWSQWRGPNRDGRSGEVGLLTEWPAEGPPLLWKGGGIGYGYSCVAVVADRIFTSGRLSGQKPGTYLFCLEADGGGKIWERFIVDDKTPPLSMPTVDGDRVYSLAHEGELICVNAANGDVVWQKNLMKEFNGDYMARNIGGGYSESVLIDGDKLVCTPGATDAALAALNKNTGEILWKAAWPADVGPQGTDTAGFSSPVISNACGIRQYVQMSGRGLIAAEAKTGKTLWAYNGIANDHANISTPIVDGDYVFGSTVHTGDPIAGTALLKLVPESGGVKAEVVYRLSHRTASNHHGGMVLLNDNVYMGHGYNRGFPLCLEFKTGKVLWRPGRGPGTGSAAIVYADGHLYFRYEDGTMALIEARPDAYKLKGTFKPPPDGDFEWTHPVISHGRLYLRGMNQLLCYNVAR